MQTFIRKSILVNTVVLLYFMLVAVACTQLNTSDPKTSISKSPGEKTDSAGLEIDLITLLGDKSNLPVTLVDIKYDPYFKTRKQYKGYLIKDVIDFAIRKGSLDTANTLVFFVCKDGYAPFMHLSNVYSNTKGYIVFEDVDEASTNHWNDSLIEKFSPFYLVWENITKDNDNYPWPYGLIKLELTVSEEVYKAIFPFNNSLLANGFYLFQNNCIMCHSVNQIGGDMGPEFNVPRNITEYWQEDDIVSFAKNPKSYRYNSKMPPITKLSDSDYRSIISYLKYMGKNKL